MFVAIQPAALLARPEMQPVMKLFADNERLVKEFLLPIDQIDQLLSSGRVLPPTREILGHPP